MGPIRILYNIIYIEFGVECKNHTIHFWISCNFVKLFFHIWSFLPKLGIEHPPCKQDLMSSKILDLWESTKKVDALQILQAPPRLIEFNGLLLILYYFYSFKLIFR